MATVKIGELRANLMDVLKFVKVKQGRVIITRYGKAIAEIVPVPASEPNRYQEQSGKPTQG